MKFSLAGEISLSKETAGTLCLSLSTGKYFRLNPTGSVICEALQTSGPEGLSSFDLSRMIVGENSTVDKPSVERDVSEFLEVLRKMGVVQRVNSS